MINDADYLSFEAGDELRKGENHLYSGALQSVGTATTLRIQSGKMAVTDGPFVETREHIGGIIVIEQEVRISFQENWYWC